MRSLPRTLALWAGPSLLLAPAVLGSPQLGPPFAPHGSSVAEHPRIIDQPNVLLIVIDDVGPDMIGAYGIGTDLPPTPNMDALAAGGLLYRRAYSHPAGSVTMAALETGRIGELTGIGFTLYEFVGDPSLSLDETIIPEMLDLGTGGEYATAMFGKFFLGNTADVGGVNAPNVMGYDHYAGVISQLYLGGNDYFTYPWVENGTTTLGGPYVTSQTVDAAVAWMNDIKQPFFCHVAFHCAHTPLHKPPAHLITQDIPDELEPHGDGRPWYKGMVEALDTEIGRMVAEMDPLVRDRTTIILIADNGTPNETVAPPLPVGHGKATTYEGGINIPMIVSGYGVTQPGSEANGLLSVSDLYATIAELAGVDLDALLPGLKLQSESIVKSFSDPTARLRDMVFAELFYPNTTTGPYQAKEYAVRGERFKYLRRGLQENEELYDLWNDPFEQVNLMFQPPTPEGLAAFQELKQFMDAAIALEPPQTP